MRFSIAEKKFQEEEINPNQLAVAGADKNLTWKELKETALQYEKKLLSLGLTSGKAVGIYGHKQADYLAVICACIKMGCPYVPMDDIYPVERVSKIQYIADIFCQVNLETKTIETSFMGDLLNEYPKAEDLIYIIFTSGSTGDPKGVQISTESVLSMLKWMHEDFNLPSDSVFMNQAPFSFDLSVYEVMYFLNFGKSIILNSREQIADSHFFPRLKEFKTNVWVSTPSFAWSQTLNEAFNETYLTEMKYFLFCGEVLPVKLVKKLMSLFPNAKILNTYGPTEATVATTLVEITEEMLTKYDSLPVGYPKKNTRVYVDNEGQICIIGDNVMKGYLNRQDLNLSKMFIENGQRGFRTGDLGYEKDGLLFCNGRMDDQIKLHGYRIELSEIEHTLTKTSLVKEAACIAIKRGNEVQRIVAFLKLEDRSTDFETFKKNIHNSIPYYMIPSEFFLIEEFPKSVNHKVDRKKLSEIYQERKIIKWV